MIPERILGLHLASNHLAFDLPRNDWKSIASISSPDVPRRVIAVVGAGASATAGLSTAVQARDVLKQKLKAVTWNAKFDGDFQDELLRLTTVYRLEATAFETVLLALSGLVRPSERLRDELRAMYSKRFRPLLCYEVLAHMMKHRFVDAVINFNFDELLDQSIEDELAPDEYYKVLSDGDSPPKGRAGRPYDLPVYIKLHGTVSHPSTLRFTREAYFGLPTQITEVVRNLLIGAPITVFSIGFAMQSFEFIALLNQVTHNSDFFHVNTHEVKPEPSLNNRWKQQRLPVDEGNPRSLDQVIGEVWKSVERPFKDGFKPRSILRHQIINRVFGPGSPADPRNYADEEYLRKRALVEAALTIAKAKGIVNLGVIASDRCGTYYDRYRATASEAPPLSKLVQDLALNEFGYAHETFCYEEPTRENVYGVVPKERFAFSKLTDAVFNQIGLRNQIPLRTSFIEDLKALYDGKEVEMRMTIDSLERAVFRHPKPICTGSSFAFHTQEMLAEPRWTLLLVSAETGEWLLDERISAVICGRKHSAAMFLLVADATYVPKLCALYGEHLQIHSRTLSWWQHNRHMTVTGTRDGPLQSIYFTRRLRSPIISPVRLEQSDTILVAEAFHAYWLKARESVVGWLSPGNLGWANMLQMFDGDHESKVPKPVVAPPLPDMPSLRDSGLLFRPQSRST
jgi:hypothetical protein